MIELQKSSFHDLLPPNLKSDETRALSYASDRQFEKLAAKILKLLIFADIMSVDEWLCDYIALLLNIRVYDVSFPLDTKRKLIQLARHNSSRKGTAKAVSDIMATVHDGAIVEPWFSYGGDPYKFKIKVDTVEHGITEDEFEKILFHIDDYKALRSHLEGITVNLKKICETVIGGACISGDHSVIKPTIKELKTRHTALIKGASVSGETVIIAVPPMPVLKTVIASMVCGAVTSGEHVILKMNSKEELLQ